MLTEGLWRSDLRRRAAGVEDGRRRRRSSVARSAQGSWWGVAGPGRLRGPRRSRCGSPGGLRCGGAARGHGGAVLCSHGARGEAVRVCGAAREWIGCRAAAVGGLIKGRLGISGMRAWRSHGGDRGGFR